MDQEKLNREKYNLCKVKINQLRMLMDRGFPIGNKEQNLLDLAEEDDDYKSAIEYFYEIYKTTNIRASLNKNYIKIDPETSRRLHLFVYYAYDFESGKTKDLGKKSVEGATRNIKSKIKGLLDEDPELTEDDISVIIISPVEIKTEKKTKNLGEIKNLTVFKENELCIDITKHKDYNKHTKLSEEEKNQVLMELGCQIRNTGTIRTNNIVSKWFGFQSGDLIMIERDLPIPVLGQKNIYYRHCA